MYYTVKYNESKKVWMVIEGNDTDTCAGYYDTEKEAQDVAKLINECAA